MSAPDITLADEFRALAAQCEERVRGTNRAEDGAFIRTLSGRLFEIGGCGTLDFIARMIADAADPMQAGRLPVDVIRTRAVALRLAADQLEQSGRAA